MQTIQTQNWTKITWLDSDKYYLLQALKKANAPKDNVLGYCSTDVMWLQVGSEPASTDIGLVEDIIKISGSEDVYVKTDVLPLYVVVQEVITGA